MPDSVVGLLVALGIFVPGYMAVRVRYLVGPPETPRSDFTLTLECLLLGFLNAILLGIVGIPFAWWYSVANPGVSPGEAREALEACLLTQCSPWLCLPVVALVVTVFCPVALGWLLGRAYRSGWYGRRVARLRAAKAQATAWDSIFVREHQPYVWLFVKDGEVFEGRVIHANTHPEPPALWLDEVKYWDEEFNEWKRCEDQHLYVSGQDVHYLLVDEARPQETMPGASLRREQQGRSPRADGEERGDPHHA